MGRTFTKEELDIILKNHLHWINEDCEGWENMRADLCDADLHEAHLGGAHLSGADLYGANLYGADLREANLGGADLGGADLRDADLHEAHLSGADLYGANLYGADLRDADLHEAHLSGADLSGANLYGADLREANLHGADLSGADLREANLGGAYLGGANLHGADLREANLGGAYLGGANLHGADLRGAKNVPFIPMACPDARSFTGWKKGLGLKGENLDVMCVVIIELEIPEDAKRSSATGRKCRCDKAVVKSIKSIDESESFDTAFSIRDNEFIYKVGETVTVNNFDENRFNECAPGIHFFINRQEAVDY